MGVVVIDSEVLGGKEEKFAGEWKLRLDWVRLQRTLKHGQANGEWTQSASGPGPPAPAPEWSAGPTLTLNTHGPHLARTTTLDNSGRSASPKGFC